MRNRFYPNLFLLLLAVVLLTTACKKDKTGDPAPAPTNAMAYKLDGMAVSASVSSQRSSGDLSMTGLTSGGAGQALYLALGPVASATTISDIPIVYTVGSVSWSSAPGLPGVASLVRITSYDASAHRMSGTFTATLAPQTGTGATGTKTITEGSFTNVTIP